MVSYLNEKFTDEQWEKLKSVKGNRTWREAILEEFGVDDES